MQSLHALLATLLLATSAHGFHYFAEENVGGQVFRRPTTAVESLLKEVAVSSENSAIVETALADKSNFGAQVSQAICVSEVTRVREAVANSTRVLYVDVRGCAVEQPKALCGAECEPLAYQVHVSGPETTPNFDAAATLKKGEAVKTPFTIDSIAQVA